MTSRQLFLTPFNFSISPSEPVLLSQTRQEANKSIDHCFTTKLKKERKSSRKKGATLSELEKICIYLVARAYDDTLRIILAQRFTLPDSDQFWSIFE